MGVIKSILRRVYNHYFVIQDKGKNNKINVKTIGVRGKLNVFVYGNDNTITIDRSCVFNGVTICVWGDGNSLKIGRDAKIQRGNIMLQKGARLVIEHNATFQEVSFVLQSKCCEIGADCMFSSGVNIRNHDGHKIINQITGAQCNSPGDILIGPHVWVGQDVTILKNSKIGEGSIVGSKALVAGDIEANSIAVGIPAKVIKHNSTWIRH